MTKNKKSIWFRDLGEFKVVRFLGLLAIPALVVYGFWGAFNKKITLGGRSGSYTYHGIDAVILGISMSVAIISFAMLGFGLSRRAKRGDLVWGSVCAISLISFVCTLIANL